MSNGTHHQLLSVGAFAAGVLLVVSSLFGDGKQPGTLDNATNSIVHKLTSKPEEASDDTDGAYQVSLNSSALVDDDQADKASDPAPPAPQNPWAFSSSENKASFTPEPAEQKAPIDVGHIYR